MRSGTKNHTIANTYTRTHVHIKLTTVPLSMGRVVYSDTEIELVLQRGTTVYISASVANSNAATVSKCRNISRANCSCQNVSTQEITFVDDSVTFRTPPLPLTLNPKHFARAHYAAPPLPYTLNTKP